MVEVLQTRHLVEALNGFRFSFSFSTGHAAVVPPPDWCVTISGEMKRRRSSTGSDLWLCLAYRTGPF